MLKQLFIKNYALIQELKITPSEKLNIITGETGAGKSIMLGAVGLMLGNRADIKSLLNTDSKCIVEGHFDLSLYKLESLFKKEDLDYEATTIIRREISPSGKSRAFVNDTPVTLDVLKKLGIKLMDVHSQHETLQLGKNSFQLKFVDVFANTLTLRNEYYRLYQDYKKELIYLNGLKEESAKATQESDYNSFLLQELAEANLQPDEQEELEERVKVAEHAEEIKLKLNEGLAILSNDEFSVASGMQQLRQALSQLAKYSDTYKNLADRIESVQIEVNDLTSEIEREEEKVNFDPEEAQMSQERLSLIYQLQQKHQVVDIASLIEIQSNLEEKVSRTLNLDNEIATSTKKVESLLQECTAKASELSKKRVACFDKLSDELTKLLAEVGMGDASVKIERSEIPLENSGFDEIQILFSANKGIAPQPLAKVASGGEFSRFMFCIKYILAEKIAMPTVIFDEIDTGVSGEIALKLGSLMKKMAENHQLITISHLPQIAAKGDQHYFVYKDTSSDKAVSKIKYLEESERIEEIAKMIGGDNPSSIAFENARELMQSS
ncbi:DNA repair protein RecN [Fulvivirga lutea]|uniref:DNA repair protein RecN n=1 Tax=Fulvivirga lutea TaxID=2810512 RepID=A0A974WJ86_9BACT|nr:DNA repair protein RecN [Fulvivirga lutea]QSE98944.1 DNA repair protein RecN [Fulvivirga lutea]